VTIAATAVYVVRDRSHVESHIHARQSGYAQCSQKYPGRKDAAMRERRCGWAQLSGVREGDLLGLPFLVLAAGLSLVLVQRIDDSRPRGT
jgi:hypothetical protein